MARTSSPARYFFKEDVMPWPLHVSIAAPFPVDNIVGEVSLEGGGACRILLTNGAFSGEVPGVPINLKLAVAPPIGTEIAQAAAPVGLDVPPVAADIDTLFTTGVAIPGDGRLVAQVRWGAACHHDRVPELQGKPRFASPEHIACAEWIGNEPRAADGSVRPLQYCGITSTFNANTPLDVNGKSLRFGEVICLAGDYYGYLDDQALADFPWAWPEMHGLTAWLAGDYRAETLFRDPAGQCSALLRIVTTENPDNLVNMAFNVGTHQFPARRYLALASQNYCHFGCTHPGSNADNNEALRLYRAYHSRALATARTARGAGADAILRKALVVDAFGCHFLTDLFAAGHIRVPRRLLAEKYGILRGSLKMSKEMHEEDNVRGLYVRPANPRAGRVVWHGYGDNMLTKSAVHQGKVKEAVRRSAAEVFAAYCVAVTGSAPVQTASAEDLVPVPLEPGVPPEANEQLIGEDTDRAEVVNHWPLYWFDQTGQIVKRITPPEQTKNAQYQYVDHAAAKYAYQPA